VYLRCYDVFIINVLCLRVTMYLLVLCICVCGVFIIGVLLLHYYFDVFVCVLCCGGSDVFIIDSVLIFK
jgi:hypothetical protein